MSEHLFPVDHIDDETIRRAVQILTTEQFTLQSGRASTIAEANGRLSVFLSTTSSSLIAIAFIGQISHLGQAFRIFTLLLLPMLLFLGLVTFARIRQSTQEDGLYTTGINRIRHFYVEVVPEIASYFVLSTHDDWEGIMTSSGIAWTRWQALLTLGFMVAVVNSVVGGVLMALFGAWFVGVPLALSVVLGLIASVLVLALEMGYTVVSVRRVRLRPPLFPTPSPPADPHV